MRNGLPNNEQHPTNNSNEQHPTNNSIETKPNLQMHPHRCLLLFAFSFFACSLYAQNAPIAVGAPARDRFEWFPAKIPGNKGAAYAYWGYNRACFLKSTIHFSSPRYDFTLFDVEATDRQSPFSFKQYFTLSRFTIPQYNYRAGYFLSDRWLISGGVDHMKYVVKQGQKALLSGVISEDISAAYAGSYLQDTFTLTRDFLQFEHTDGLNLVSVEFEFLQPLAVSKSGNFCLKWNIGFGGVWVVTRTDVRILGEGINNDFHVAGFALAAKTGPRFEFFKRFFLSPEFKSGYMTIPDVLIENAAPKYADHTLIFFERYVVAGVYFRLKKKG